MALSTTSNVLYLKKSDIKALPLQCKKKVNMMPEQNTEKQRGIRNPVCTGTLSLFRKFCVKTPISDRA
jgi:hypothetical protein